MKRASNPPRLQVATPSGKNPRRLERFGVYMVIGMFALGVYGQYAGRGTQVPQPPQPPAKPVYEFQHIGGSSADRTASTDRQKRRDGQEPGYDKTVGIRL
ncbi:hypothetical protein LMK08_15690 [Metapseudomonas furukawaii]|uniref:hypothetical protein n=1 Tax=Metapseudomonas furukawaii TaxID=1149133 RepID=UPI00227B12BB|nr:hypothetical protein [Pseudomonas furukawaii]WAG76821.1 hypothetical protein LMK08_15690 [Pseudomonas furukawaii]